VDEDEGEVYVDPVDQAERIARLVAEARQQQAKEDRMLFADHFKATAEMLDALTGGVRQLNETFTIALKVAALAPQATAPEDSMDSKMKEMMFAVVAKQMGIDPGILSNFAKMANAPKPTNGTPPKSPANGAPPRPPTNGVK
jgi:hypothetical protein